MKIFAKNVTAIDIAVFVLIPFLSSIIALSFNVPFIISIFLFLGIPILWLSIRNPEKVKNVFVFALIFSIPVSLIADYLGILNKAWTVPDSIFAFRILNGIPVEDFIWGFCGVCGSTLFYEHFFDREGTQKINPKIKYLLGGFIVMTSVFLATLQLNHHLLYIEYFFFWGGIFLFVIPLSIFLFNNPKFFPRFIYATVYFFAISLLFELTSLKLGHWTFLDGTFIGWIELFGQRLPFEEFFYWFCVGGASVLSFYEFFVDDNA